MEYIVHTRFKDKAICGDVNIPAKTVCDSVSGVIFYGNKAICYAGSQNAFEHFARNDDKNGMERGKLTQNIIKLLQKKDEKHQERWNKIWADPLCNTLRQKEHEDYFLWDTPFYDAEIKDLKYIYGLIKDVK